MLGLSLAPNPSLRLYRFETATPRRCTLRAGVICGNVRYENDGKLSGNRTREHLVTSPKEFDTQAFFAAVDARRCDQQLSWPALAAAIWEQSHVLNSRDNYHPISPSTIRNLAKRQDTSCQHALFLLRWLRVPPEAFIASPCQGTAGVPLPPADEAHRLRWNLRKLYEALNAARAARGATWPQAAAHLHCTSSQLAGLRTVKFTIGMRLAMRITQSLHRPAADFVYAAEW